MELKKINPTYFFIGLITLFLGFRVYFYTVTPAEWGDSYRFLRAAEFISKFSYPLDEKRLPLFPILLAPAFLINVDPILIGRAMVTIFSVVTLYLIFKISLIFNKNFLSALLATFLLAFSPVYFYWSSKIYAEALFVLLTVAAFYFYLSYVNVKKSKLQALILGLLCGLTFMTRFEGFLLFFSFLCLYLYKRKGSNIVIFAGSFLLMSLPYFIFRYMNLHTLTSTYLEEPSTFVFSVREIWVFLVSLVFSLAFVPLLKFSSFSISQFKRTIQWKYLPLYMYFLLQLILCLYWQAAIPRLFISILPFISIYVGISLTHVRLKSYSLYDYLFWMSLLGFIFASRMGLRLPFMVPGKYFVLVLVINVLSIIMLLLRKPIIYITGLCFCAVLSSIIVTNFFKTTYKTVYDASVYSLNLSGKITYSDETGVPSWYLRNGKGKYYDLDLTTFQEYTWLKENDISYIIDTNEHNEGSKLECFKTPSLQNKFVLIKKFRSTVGVTETTSSIYKVL